MKKKLWISLVLILLIVVLAGGFYGGYRLIRHENKQKQQIQDLQVSLKKLAAENDALSRTETNWGLDSYNYFAIGNSITVHRICDFWWNEVGMAASDAEHDYFHQVLSHLNRTHSKVKGEAFYFLDWEINSEDRNGVLDELDAFLSPRLDLVTIQLGENVTNTGTYETDFVSLINYVKAKAPFARIVVIGDFWSNGDRNQMKINAVTATGVEFVSLEGITDNEAYYCGLGTTVYDADGKTHIVEHDGVADHPGDNGMKEIADRIIKVLTSE